jgi:hypothetical protein
MKTYVYILIDEGDNLAVYRSREEAEKAAKYYDLEEWYIEEKELK